MLYQQPFSVEFQVSKFLPRTRWPEHCDGIRHLVVCQSEYHATFVGGVKAVASRQLHRPSLIADGDLYFRTDGVSCRVHTDQP